MHFKNKAGPAAPFQIAYQEGEEDEEGEEFLQMI
jgi:hypothetical protein